DLPRTRDQLVVGDLAGQEEPVLVEARSAAEAGNLEATALVAGVDRLDDRIDVALVLLRDHHELVRDGEVDVAVHVAEELRELGAARVNLVHGARDAAEERRRLARARGVDSTHDLWHLGELFDRASLGDALRAESEEHVAADAQVRGWLDETREF